MGIVETVRWQDDSRRAPSTEERLTVGHLEARDRALDHLQRASSTLDALVTIERGDASKGVTSPRYDDVEKLHRELTGLVKRLDEVYV